MDQPPHHASDSARRRAERERALVALAQGGEQAATEELIEHWRGRIRTLASRYFLPGAEGDDLQQEGMIGLIQAIRGFDDTRGGSFGAFAETCISRQMLMAVRRATRSKHQVLSDALSLEWRDADGAGIADVIDGPSREWPEQQAIAREGVAVLARAAGERLSELEAQVLILFADGFSHAEIATQVGRSAKAVDNAIQRIRRKVGPHIAAWDPSLAPTP